jgi:hypothetical protein
VAEGDIVGAEAEGTAPIAIPPSAAEPTGLAPNATYHYRLRAAYAGLEVETDPAATFTTQPVAKPTVSLDPVTTHSDTTATFTGEVDTNAPAVLNPQAEAAFKAEWHISCNPACPNLAPAGGAGSVEAEAGSETVEVDATGLEPNTSYEVTLEATNAGGAESSAQTFATDLVAPTVNPGPGRSDGKGGYHLEAALNPRNSAISSCVFEYGLSAAYGQSIPCDSNPGAVNKTVFVTAHLTGLTLGTTYHFRLTAANAAGPTASADATFVPGGSCPNEARREEQESGFLPECRAYEMVTPSFKQGFAPFKPNYGDGAVAYVSTGSFAGNSYGSLGNTYLALRSETGWSSIAMNPPGEQWVYISGEGNQEGRSNDFRSELWIMRPRTEGPGERGVDHPERDRVYLRRPDGVFSLIAPNPGTANLRVLAATPDLSHVVLGEDPGLGLGSNAYEVSGGDQVLRPIGVDNTGALLPGVGTPGGGPCLQGFSADGRVIFFGQGDQFHGCFKPRARVGGTTTIEMSASQCTRGVGDPGGACNAESGVSPVGFASDGSRAFFTTTQQLVNGDTDEGNDLYACDIPAGPIAPEGPLNPCPNLRQLSAGAGSADVEGVAGAASSGISKDGSHVYFVAQGVLAVNAGANDETAVAGAHNLYVWETDAEHPEGHITFLARIANPDDLLRNSETQTTPDGRYLLIGTTTPLVSSGPTADTDGANDVYCYDSQTEEWLRLSTDATGSGGNAEFHTQVGFRKALTDDGHTVVFITAEALSPSDTNSGRDVYAWHEGQVSLISSGGGEDPGISSSGTDVYFTTNDQVTADDTDTSSDVYTARIGGGFDLREPEPPCEAEACKGPPPPTTSSSAPGSAGLVDGGNIKEKPRRCPKGKRKVRNKAGKSRCVPKRSGSRHGKRHHTAGRNGGAHK